MRPSSFSSLGTYGNHEELFGLLLSISIHHKGATVFCAVDRKTKEYILNSTPKLDLDIRWNLSPEKYSGLDRQAMIAKDVWRDFLMEKAEVIYEALKHSDDTLYLDADILVLDEINDIDKSKQLGVSPHYIRKQSTDTFGYYNGGVIWTNQKSLKDDWIEFTKTSRFCDQAAIEDLAEKYDIFEFGENYNFSWWRVTQSDAKPQEIINNLTIQNKKIYYKGKPLKFIHTHFYENRADFKLFNDVMIQCFNFIKDYKSLLIISRILDGKWKIQMPMQPFGGKWNHANDSFRELLLLLQSKNKDVEVSTDNSSGHIWLNKNILLYDRPNLDWFNDEALKSFKVLLGNGDIKKEGYHLSSHNVNVSPWIFWPRRPCAVEEKLKENLLKYDERKTQSIFIGNYENHVQKQFRNNNEWKDVIDEFYCTSGSKHIFSQNEYLDKIRNSKYGLCLRGFGSKCHREVELMAFGVVPLVTPEVSINSYHDTLVENKHYIYVDNPSEVKLKIDSISKDHWSEMSNNCANWYYKNIHSDNCWDTMIRGLLHND